MRHAKGVRMHAPTDGLVPFFTADHRHCDDLWAAVEAAAEQGQEAAKAACDAFYATTRLHLDLEEKFLKVIQQKPLTIL